MKEKIPSIISENNYETVELCEFFNLGYEILRKLEIFNCFLNASNINFDDEKEKKYLHDYFKNYEKMNDNNFCNNNKCQQYCEYITFINRLFGKYINRHCYCFESNDCKEIYPFYFKCYFTPMGSYFNNRDKRNEESYFEKSEQQFLQDVQFNHGNKQNIGMRIAYH
ncbi:PIR Superfamily Protein [Plasmodium ovale wallikeri]|uniref:PIR Superfamily Protein n=1 Tax=Plasmodium ovale wallikeri TaxID=864142 RepID=A0A1A9ANT3_PLAOA|nr:PIR Superfamily Protein [Plasmodium ovale wallikeri]SBT58329.1 PIR Superfamily Protein [Plasmodium ovale wallikeri]